jgi:hypothetical protein
LKVVPLGSAVAASCSQRPARATSTPRSTLQQQHIRACTQVHRPCAEHASAMPSTTVSRPRRLLCCSCHARAGLQSWWEARASNTSVSCKEKQPTRLLFRAASSPLGG